VFTRVYQTLRDTGTLPGVRIAAERDVNEGVDEEVGIIPMVQSSPRASTRRIARRLRVLHTRVWRRLHAEGMYPYHVQRVLTSLTWRFCSEAGILQMAQWQSPVASLHHVY